jgi:hypothetical protein
MINLIMLISYIIIKIVDLMVLLWWILMLTLWYILEIIKIRILVNHNKIRDKKEHNQQRHKNNLFSYCKIIIIIDLVLIYKVQCHSM